MSLLARSGLSALAFVVACGGAPPAETTPAATPGPAPQTSGGVDGATTGDVLPLGAFSIYTAVGVIDVREDGGFYENGELVGAFKTDGRLLNVDGAEIGRLTPGGRIYFAGRLDTAAIDPTGTRLASPTEVIASFDPSGNLVVGGTTLEVRGYTPALSRSILFAFAMYAALLGVAQNLPQQITPAQQVPPPSGQVL